MKRVTLYTIATFAIFTLFIAGRTVLAQGKSANLVQNPGAEAGTGGMPSDWEKAVFPAAMSLDGVDYIWHAKIAHTGKHSLCFKKTGNGFFPVAQWTQTIPYTGTAQRLNVSVWIKTRDAKKATLAVSCRNKDGEQTMREFAAQVNDNGAPITQEWKQYKTTLTVPSGTTEIVVAPEMYGPGVAWFDDISIIPAT